jgi:hypothetical protein
MASFGSGVVDAVKDLLGVEDKPPGLQGEGPSWKTRLREGAYTSPSGKRIVFAWENLSREMTKRTVGFDFPNINDSYIQGNGFSARRYPMRCYFSGRNCDVFATAFEAALLEEGPGQLEHPMYGTVTVVPFGDITRRDDLKDAANQSVVEVTFFTTTGAVYPSSPNAPKSEVQAALDKFNASAATQFDEERARLPKSVVADANLMANVRGKIALASRTLSKVAAVNTAVIKEFRQLQSDLNFALDVLVGQPLQLAQQVVNMIEAPAKALAGIEDRLAGYRTLARTIFTKPDSAGAFDGTVFERTRQKLIGDFQMDSVVTMSAVAGSVASVINHTYATKPEAIAAAEEVLRQFDELVAWRDQRLAGLEQIDIGDAYQALLETVSLVAGYLIQISQTLVPERRVVLDRPRTLIDVCAQVYGAIDNDTLDFFISTNNLSGDELLELQRGRLVVYYR